MSIVRTISVNKLVFALSENGFSKKEILIPIILFVRGEGHSHQRRDVLVEHHALIQGGHHRAGLKERKKRE